MTDDCSGVQGEPGTKPGGFIRSTRRTLYEKIAFWRAKTFYIKPDGFQYSALTDLTDDCSGVQGEPGTKPGVIYQEYKANLVRKNRVSYQEYKANLVRKNRVSYQEYKANLVRKNRVIRSTRRTLYEKTA
ncbi:MAG: hypothetical protein DRR19_07905 [Candidatus Parabeggiatoa sp. nov. 1]|nr:MAG: hypothetical protein DRR19_07905 [Gammaproteobacteria bacterium]